MFLFPYTVDYTNPCKLGWIYNAGTKKCYRHVNEEKTKEEAETFCHGVGGVLVGSFNSSEAEVINNIAPFGTHIWSDLTKDSKSGNNTINAVLVFQIMKVNYVPYI